MEKTERLTWIELLRILFMLMVLILHVNLFGGILSGVPFGGASYFFSWLLESLCFCSVNGYAMITGYVSCESRFRYCRIVPLWLQVCFWNIVITAVFALIGIGEVGSKSFLTALLPVSHNAYWYFTSYFGMFFFIPFFNILIGQLDFKKFTALVLTAFLLFSFFSETLCGEKDIFYVASGFSVLWMSVMYFFGAYIKRFGDKIKLKRWGWAAIYFVSSAIPAIDSYILDVVSVDSFDMLGRNSLGGYTITYTSPFCVISAFSLIMLFKDIKIGGRTAVRVINFFSSASFGVYLIHLHSLIWEQKSSIKNFCSPIVDMSAPLLILTIIAAALAAYIVFALLEQLRILLFRLIRVRELTFAAADKISSKLRSMRLK